MKDGKLYLKANSFTEPIPIFIMLKALGIESEYVNPKILLGYNSINRNRKMDYGVFDIMFTRYCTQ